MSFLKFKLCLICNSTEWWKKIFPISFFNPPGFISVYMYVQFVSLLTMKIEVFNLLPSFLLPSDSHCPLGCLSLSCRGWEEIHRGNKSSPQRWRSWTPCTNPLNLTLIDQVVPRQKLVSLLPPMFAIKLVLVVSIDLVYSVAKGVLIKTRSLIRLSLA